jgi:hypothetical protein
MGDKGSWFVKLPNHESAVVPKAKIVNYLLSLTHPVGRSKAKFFMQFGFSPGSWEELAEALARHVADHEVASVEQSPFGTRYVVEGIIHTPDKREPIIRSVWFVEAEGGVPRFVTAYPLKLSEGEDDTRVG